MEIVGYAFIKKDAKSCISPIDKQKFLGKICRVFEFTIDGSVLVLDDQAEGLALFDACDIKASFLCEVQGNVICPPNLDYTQKLCYVAKCISRKGGYGDIIKQMVIQVSLHKGVFNDNFIWQKQ